MSDAVLEQKGGIGSHNVQIKEQINQYGLSYADVKSLCTDLIQSELSTYKEEALITAKEREEKLRNNIIQKLADEITKNENILEEFKNPDLQFSYVNAQKAYIRVGTDELENILSELLFNRIKESKRTLLQLTLNESLNIVPMLLPQQLNILAICFMLRYTISKSVNNHNSLKEYLLTSLLPHFVGDLKKNSLYQHLEYTRCGQVSSSELRFEHIISRTYKGLFLKGIPLAEIEELKNKYPTLFLPCLNNKELWQINAINDEFLNDQNIADENDNKEIQRLFDENLMSGEEIKNKVIELLPPVKEVFEIWNNSSLKNLTLTTVGIVIGATYSKQIVGKEYDLNIWI